MFPVHKHLGKNRPFHFFVLWVLCFTSCLIIHTNIAQAQNNIASNAPGKQKEATINEGGIVSGRISAGLLSAQAHEIVYWPAGSKDKLSELTWTTTGLFMISGGISLHPVDWFKLNADIQFKAGSGSNEMDDYDWAYVGREWSDWSHHSDVEVTEGRIFDINTEFIFYQQQKIAVSCLLGYRQDNWEWEARGGKFVYSVDSFRDYRGLFTPGELGITYEQTFDVPYLGVGFQVDLDPVRLNGRLIGSFLSSASDKDHHHIRNLYYERDFDYGNMISLDINGSYFFTNNLALMARFQFCNYFRTEGDTTITNLSTGTKTVYNDIAGIDNQTSMFSLGLVFSF